MSDYLQLTVTPKQKKYYCCFCLIKLYIGIEVIFVRHVCSSLSEDRGQTNSQIKSTETAVDFRAVQYMVKIAGSQYQQMQVLCCKDLNKLLQHNCFSSDRKRIKQLQLCTFSDDFCNCTGACPTTTVVQKQGRVQRGTTSLEFAWPPQMPPTQRG